MSLDTFEKLSSDRREEIIAAGIRAFSRNSFRDVRTDDITRACRISKGILFHYFRSKKDYYLYCLEVSMERLTRKTEDPGGDGFYGILFAEMDRKMALCTRFGDEMRMVNMASRDPSAEIALPKAAILRKYTEAVRAESSRVLDRAMETLPLKTKGRESAAAEGMLMYVNAVLGKYLLAYREDPDGFFENSAEIKEEIRAYLDLMLYGIADEVGP